MFEVPNVQRVPGQWGELESVGQNHIFRANVGANTGTYPNADPNTSPNTRSNTGSNT